MCPHGEEAIIGPADQAATSPGIPRRELLRWLLASPLLWAADPVRALEDIAAPFADPSAGAGPERIRAAADAVDVFDFRRVAERTLSEAHYAYLAMGVQHEVTLRANRQGFERWALRPRRLRNVRGLDTGTRLFGEPLSCPIVLAPAGSQRAFHPGGEVAVARAARRADHLQILAMSASASLEEVHDARGAPVWYQMYTPRVWTWTRSQLRRVEAAGCPALVLTVDMMGQGANRDRIRRFRKRENPECLSCHDSAARNALIAADRAANAIGIDTSGWFRDVMAIDWSDVDRIRDATSMKLVIKGILTAEDAALCVEHGVDALVVSNHGGRAEDSGLSTIGVLPEIVAAVAGRIPILVDSGFRRGTDVFKALALGATAVCIGRPYLWGLASFGADGVESVLRLLRSELESAMRQMGTRSIADITADHVRAVVPPPPA